MSVSDAVGARDKVSAIVRSLPGTCEIVYLINLIQKRWIRAGNSSKFLTPKCETKGLWSVSTLNDIPSKYSLNLSHAQVKTNASFSI